MTVLPRSRRSAPSYQPGSMAALAVAIVIICGAVGWSIAALDARLVLAALGGLLAFTALVVRPYESLVCFGVLWGTTHVVFADVALANVGSFQLTLSRAVGLLLLGGLVIALIGPYGIALAPKAGRPVLMLLVAFGVLFAGGLVVVSQTSNGASDALRIAGGVTICLAAYTFVTTRARLLKLALLVSGGVVVGAVVAVFEFVLIKSDASLANSIFGAAAVKVSTDPITGAAVKRAAGPLGGSDESAGVFVIAFCFALLVFTLRRERGRDMWPVLAMAVLAAGVAATVTRTAAAALVIGTAVWAIQSQSRRLSPAGTRIAALVTSIVLVVGLVFAVGVTNVQNRLADANPSGAGFAQGRSSIWHTEIVSLEHSSVLHLLVGQGPHASYVLVPGVGTSVIQAQAPHNVGLWLLVETGVVGLLIFAAFLFALGRAYFWAARNLRYTDAGRIGAVGLAALACFLTLSAFGNTVVSPGIGWYFFLFVGATLRGTVDSFSVPEEPAEG